MQCIMLRGLARRSGDQPQVSEGPPDADGTVERLTLMTAREVHSKGTISNAVITSRFLAIVGIWLVHDLSLASQSSLIAQTSQPPGSVKQTTAKPAVQKPEKQSSGTATKKNQKPSESQAPTERNSRANRENAPVGLVATAGGGFVYKTLAGPLVEIGYNLGGIGQVAVSVAYGLGQDAIETSGEKFNRTSQLR